MPLPAALQARLAQRGILKAEQVEAANNKTNQKATEDEEKKEETEEIIAESYDDPNEEVSSVIKNQAPFDSGIEIDEIANCPNTANAYHICSDYCKKRYGLKKFQPNPVLERRRIRMLKIYPLPAGWKEIPDIQTNRYYYWNVETDQVSWYSPSYPKAEIMLSKRAISDEIAKRVLSERDEDDEDEEEDNEDNDDDEEEEDEDDNYEEGNEDEEVPVQEFMSRPRSSKFKEDLDDFLSSYTNEPVVDTLSKIANNQPNNRQRVNQQHKKQRKEEFDPMDPASYSDIPRGNWSSGLELKGRNGEKQEKK